MRQIRKYTLPTNYPRTHLVVSTDWKFLDFQVQNGLMVVWIMCDVESEELKDVCLVLKFTGNYAYKNERYLGTCQKEELVYHLFEIE